MLSGFASRGLSVVLGFAITYYIGRHFGPEASGEYALLTQTGMLLSLFALLGTDFSVVREYSAVTRGQQMVSQAALVRLIIAIFGLNVALIGLLAALPTSWTFDVVGISPGFFPVMIIALVLVARSMTRLSAAFLRSQGEHGFGQLVELLLIPIIVLLGIVLAQPSSVGETLVMTAAAGGCAAILGIGRMMRHSGNGPTRLAVSIAHLIRVGLPIWGLGVALNFADWFALATVSANAGLSEAGIFRIAMLVGTSLLFAVQGLITVVGAQIARAQHDGDLASVALLSRRATLLSFGIISPAATLLWFGAEAILRFVGPEFVAGADALRIFLIGQIVYSLFSVSSQALAMLGHARFNLVIDLSCTATFLGLAPWATATWGIEGMALAMAAFLTARSVIAFGWLRYKTGINTITGGMHPNSSI